MKIAFDLGLNSGLNVIAYNKLMPNLEKTYGFEVIYDYAKCEWIEKFILDGRLNIIPFALGNEEKVGNFYLNKQLSVCSYCDFPIITRQLIWQNGKKYRLTQQQWINFVVTII